MKQPIYTHSTEQTELERIETAPTSTHKFPWKVFVGVLISIPVGAIALLYGGLYVLSWSLGSTDPCDMSSPTPEQQPNVQPSPRNSP
jgi:hypothetical protein